MDVTGELTHRGASRNYSGPDRRGAPESTTDAAVVGAVLFAATWAAVGVLIALGFEGFPSGSSIPGLLTATAVVTAGTVAAFSLVRWRLIGDTNALLVGAAMVAFAGYRLIRDGLAGEPTGWLAAVAGAGLLLALAALVAARLVPAVDTRVHPALVVVGAAAGTIALAILAAEVPALLAVAGVRTGGMSDGTVVGANLTMAAAWATLAVAYTRQARGRRAGLNGRRSHGWHAWHGWLGVMFLGLAQGRLARVLAIDMGGWALAAQFFNVVAMTLAALGAHRELRMAFGDQRRQALAWATTAQRVGARAQAERAAAEERDHDLRNALFAIDGAARLLERHHDRLDADQRRSMAAAVAREIERLQRLVAGPATERPEPFDVADAIEAVLIMERGRDRPVAWDLPAGLTATGQPHATAEAVRNLLDNAAHHAPSAPVEVSGWRENGHVVVAIEDRGPGLPPGLPIFERGISGRGSTGEGLGLYTARRLMMAQGGELTAADRPGGGASFVLRLPAAVEGEAMNEGYQLLHGAERHGPLLPAGPSGGPDGHR